MATSYPGTTYFSGDVVSYQDSYSVEAGWVRSYRALGLRNRADYIPVTDSNTLSDAAQYNLPSNNPAVIPAREGRTMGQAVLDLLSMQQNQTALSAAGIGNYTSAGYGGVGTAVLSGSESGSPPYGYSVASITVSQPGSGYTVAPSVVLAGGGGTGASSRRRSQAARSPDSLSSPAGQRYTTAPTVVISTLPTTTVSDLANLTVIPPFPSASPVRGLFNRSRTRSRRAIPTTGCTLTSRATSGFSISGCLRTTLSRWAARTSAG